MEGSFWFPVSRDVAGQPAKFFGVWVVLPDGDSMSSVESFCPERTEYHLAAALNLLSWPYSSGSDDERIV